MNTFCTGERFKEILKLRQHGATHWRPLGYTIEAKVSFPNSSLNSVSGTPVVHDEGYEYLDTVWQTVCSVRAGIEQVLQQEWRRLMRRESLDATELASACWFGRWRKFDLKKPAHCPDTSNAILVPWVCGHSFLVQLPLR